MKIDKNYYPGFVRKAMTFSIDDGNISMDTKFIDIVKPHGITGTFNLFCIREELNAEQYREMYKGFGIANHCKLHPAALDPNEKYNIKNEKLPAEGGQSGYLYESDLEGVYFIESDPVRRPGKWMKIATAKAYCKLIAEAKKDIEAVFGKGSIKSFVWPFVAQKDEKIHKYLAKKGYRSVRTTGSTLDTTGFAVPKERMSWSYNANHLQLLEVAEKFESYPDDGELKFFCFGVHSVDFQTSKNWCDLEEYACKYGNRPEEFWYAPVDDIFDYVDALDCLIVEGDRVENPTDITLYVVVDGVRIKLAPHSFFISKQGE